MLGRNKFPSVRELGNVFGYVTKWAFRRWLTCVRSGTESGTWTCCGREQNRCPSSLLQSLGLNVQSADINPCRRANTGQINLQAQVVIAKTALRADAEALGKELQISSGRPKRAGLGERRKSNRHPGCHLAEQLGGSDVVAQTIRRGGRGRGKTGIQIE